MNEAAEIAFQHVLDLVVTKGEASMADIEAAEGLAEVPTASTLAIRWRCCSRSGSRARTTRRRRMDVRRLTASKHEQMRKVVEEEREICARGDCDPGSQEGHTYNDTRTFAPPVA